MKTATFTVHATQAQSERWKRAADAEGYRSTGSWLADAADAYVKARARAGRPLPLAWRRGRFSVVVEGGEEISTPGYVSPPFGAFRGTTEGRGLRACKRFSLVYLPTRCIVATLRSFAQCKALASELAPVYLQDRTLAEGIADRHRREAS